MSSAPAGWYPDPEITGSARYWDGAAWTPRAPAAPAVGKKRTASSVLSGFAIALGALVPLSIVTVALVGLLLNRLAWGFGMPDADAGIPTTMLVFARSGAAGGIAIALVGVLLAILATTRKARARTGVLIAAWALIGFAFFCIGLVFALGALLEI